MKGRLERGRRNKAERGELFHSVPWGYVLSSDGAVEARSRRASPSATVRRLFDMFSGVGQLTARPSAPAATLYGVKLPSAANGSGKLVWRVATRRRSYLCTRRLAPSAIRRCVCIRASPDAGPRWTPRARLLTAGDVARLRNGPCCCTAACRHTSLGSRHEANQRQLRENLNQPGNEGRASRPAPSC